MVYKRYFIFFWNDFLHLYITVCNLWSAVRLPSKVFTAMWTGSSSQAA